MVVCGRTGAKTDLGGFSVRPVAELESGILGWVGDWMTGSILRTPRLRRGRHPEKTSSLFSVPVGWDETRGRPTGVRVWCPRPGEIPSGPSRGFDPDPVRTEGYPRPW